MTYHVELTGSARRDVLALDDVVYARVRPAIEGLENDPRPPHARKLRSRRNSWRLRVGDYRVLYEVSEEQRVVTVFRVRHRREAYR